MHPWKIMTLPVVSDALLLKEVLWGFLGIIFVSISSPLVQVLHPLPRLIHVGKNFLHLISSHLFKIII
jgi:hypothetical protein